MKINFFYLHCSAILFASSVLAQIPNAGFEDWGSNGNPVDWWTSNAAPIYTNIIKTSDAHSGSWAVEGDVVNVNGIGVGPAIISGEEGDGIPINFRPSSLRGYYKFVSINNDYMQVQANFKKDGVGMGVGAANLNPVGSYTEFSIDIIYIDGVVPDTALIAVFIAGSGGFPNVGSKMFVDDLSWGGTSDVEIFSDQIPAEYTLEQNYPNPFNPSTTIRYSIPAVTLSGVEGSRVTLKVFDLLGNEVTTLVNEEQQAGSYEVYFDATGLSSGMYFYKLQTSNFVETKKMLLLK